MFALSDGAAALTQREELFDDLEVPVDLVDVRVRAEVGAAVLDDVPRAEDAWPLLVRDSDDGVGLPVLQVDVVAGAVLLDEIVLEQERLVLASTDDVVDRIDLLHQHRGLHVFVAVEVRADAVAQVLRLADVEDGVVAVAHDVHTGLGGKVGDRFAGWSAPRLMLSPYLPILEYKARCEKETPTLPVAPSHARVRPRRRAVPVRGLGHLRRRAHDHPRRRRSVAARRAVRTARLRARQRRLSGLQRRAVPPRSRADDRDAAPLRREPTGRRGRLPHRAAGNRSAPRAHPHRPAHRHRRAPHRRPGGPARARSRADARRSRPARSGRASRSSSGSTRWRSPTATRSSRGARARAPIAGSERSSSRSRSTAERSPRASRISSSAPTARG